MCLFAVLTVQLNELRVDGFDDETRCINFLATNTVVLGLSVYSTMHLGALTLGR